MFAVSQESWDSRDPRVEMVRLERLERRDSLELRVCVVCLVKMERPVLLGLQDLPALRESEASRDSRDHQASRVCLDPRGPPVREVNLEIREFLERPEGQGLPDPEVSEGSQEREAVLGHRGSRGPGVYQEHQEPTAPRVVWDPRGQLELRVLQDCRECPEREARLGIQDQRATEAIMEIRDQKELRVKTAQEV